VIHFFNCLFYRFRLYRFYQAHPDLKRGLSKKWLHRIADAVLCPDNAKINCVPNAGACQEGHQVMHNGLLIGQDGYYGAEVTRMLQMNRGIHEPQEEALFQEVLTRIPVGGSMMELGAYWGFYSLWFHQRVPQARCILVEGESENMQVGQRNFKLNGREATFLQAWIGAHDEIKEGASPTLCVDSLLARYGWDHLDVLHSDIQGHEVKMLQGAKKALAEKRIDWIFISTHVNHELHEQCKKNLLEQAYEIVCSVNLDETFSDDGLIVAKSPLLPPLLVPPVSRRARKLFQAFG
jgi:hypothetical protein